MVFTELCTESVVALKITGTFERNLLAKLAREIEEGRRILCERLGGDCISGGSRRGQPSSVCHGFIVRCLCPLRLCRLFFLGWASSSSWRTGVDPFFVCSLGKVTLELLFFVWVRLSSLLCSSSSSEEPSFSLMRFILSL